MSKSHKRKAVETTATAARSNVTPLIRENLGMPNQPKGDEHAQLRDPEVIRLAGTIGKAWDLEKANECYQLFASANTKAGNAVVLMVDAFQAYPQRLSVETLNALYRMHKAEDTAQAFIRAFKTECKALGIGHDSDGNRVKTHYLTILKPAKSDTIVSKLKPHERAGGNRVNEASVLNKVGDYALTLFKSKGGAAEVMAFQTKVNAVLDTIAEKGEFTRYSNKKTA